MNITVSFLWAVFTLGHIIGWARLLSCPFPPSGSAFTLVTTCLLVQVHRSLPCPSTNVEYIHGVHFILYSVDANNSHLAIFLFQHLPCSTYDEMETEQPTFLVGQVASTPPADSAWRRMNRAGDHLLARCPSTEWLCSH